MNRERLDAVCEWGILALVLLILLAGPLMFGAVGPFGFLVLQFATAGVLGLWMVRLWLADKPRLLWPPVCWGVVAFVAYAVARYWTADIEYVARGEVVRVLLYAGLFFAILNNLYRQEQVTILDFGLVFLGMGIAGYAIYQFATNSDWVWNVIKPYPHRGSGTYVCPNHLGGFLELVLPLALAYTLTGRLKPVTRILVGYAGAVMIGGIVVSVSRGTWVATGLALAGLFGVLAFSRRFRLPALVLLGVLVIGGLWFMPRGFAFQQRARQLVGTGTQVGEDLRFAMWAPAARMWQDHPLWGVGPGHFDARFGAYRPARVQPRPDKVHNDYLNTLVDWGVAGGLLVLSAWVLLASGWLKTWRAVRVGNSDLGFKNGSNKMAFVLGASAGLIAILAHSAVDFNMHIPANAILVVTLMALLASHLRFATERPWTRSSAWIRAATSVLLVAGVSLLTWLGIRSAGEQRWLARADRLPPCSAEQVAALKEAFAVERQNHETAYRIGEALRRRSQEGGEEYADFPGLTYQDLATEAADWFRRARRLNPWHALSWAGEGWCLDWLKRFGESAACFDRAAQLEPNSYFIMGQLGRHYLEQGHPAAARYCFERSVRLQYFQNDIAWNYLEIVNQLLRDAAGEDLSSRLKAPAQP